MEGSIQPPVLLVKCDELDLHMMVTFSTTTIVECKSSNIPFSFNEHVTLSNINKNLIKSLNCTDFIMDVLDMA